MPSEKQDLRVQKTHKVIRTAFVELLQEKTYENIAVQEILDRALVNRNTFYKYYSGKSDLAGAMISELKAEYTDLIDERVNLDNLNEFIEILLPKFYEKRRVILALWTIKTKRHHLWDDMFLMIKNNYIATQQRHLPQKDLDYQGEMVAHLMLHTWQYYFKQDLPVPIRQVWAELGEIIKAVQTA
ncbi:AcrR family transcriptional regulator [Bibersteinia trehalosi USDA-ARS-USMARC-188]|uniref:AcrR family transcriptional regulator n=1 Tax=Bibersteinia trehalosi USDA-ARS-USMARC-188 TaxID=1263829 RepID=A0A4V7ICY3_BIBTR|nr:TetR family transcriptional regulator [Bibersteinia trehalosi]AHG82782.1 AcrR family transcriptional regulator [Bibersteinia trehalosi USDA-ARS-USMARC-188]